MVVSATVVIDPGPVSTALLTRTSMRPQVASTVAAPEVSDSRSCRSIRTGRARTP